MADWKRIGPLLLVLSLPLAVACTGTLEPVDGEFGGDGDGDVDAGAPSAQETQFRNNVEPLLTSSRPLGTCAGCHVGAAPTGGAIFGPSLIGSYQAILTNNQLSNPSANSAMISRGTHTGNAFCTAPGQPYVECTQDEITIITAWIDAEIAAGNVQ